MDKKLSFTQTQTPTGSVPGMEMIQSIFLSLVSTLGSLLSVALSFALVNIFLTDLRMDVHTPRRIVSTYWGTLQSDRGRGVRLYAATPSTSPHTPASLTAGPPSPLSQRARGKWDVGSLTLIQTPLLIPPPPLHSGDTVL